MNVTSYLKRAENPATRAAQYADLVKEYYDSVTPFYRWGWGENFHFAPFLGDEPVSRALEAQQRLLVREAGITRGKKVLDVGCGVGGPTRSIARMTGAHITGITISPAQVQMAQRMTARQGLEDLCYVMLGDAMEMGFEDRSFDVVYMIESACHMPDRAAFFAQCARVLRPGGTLAGWDWIRTSESEDAVEKALIDPICSYFTLPNLYTLTELRGHLEGAGLEVLRAEDMGQEGSATRRWWNPLEVQLDSWLSHIACRLSSTLAMMRKSGELLVSAGRAGVFSPLGFFSARKPIPR